jgi:DNA polymerase III alpha subunit
MKPLRDLADELGIKSIITNDAHYTRKEDHRIQKCLMLINMRKSYQDSDVAGSFFDDVEVEQKEVDDRESGDSDPIFETPSELYLKTAEEMREACIIEGGEDGRVEREMANTLEIANKIEFEMPIIDASDTSQYYLPAYPLEKDVQYDAYSQEEYSIPEYVKEAIIKELHDEGHEEVRELSDYMSDAEIEALRFLMWMCERNLEKLVRPKLEAKGEPLPMSFWIENPPEGFSVDHAHNSPDELWIKDRIAEGKSIDDILQIYRDRLAYETGVVVAKKFVNYFLIVQSYIGLTKSDGAAVGPGRGSGAGALLNYLSGITAVDPLPNDLLFFRFLNPERTGYP